MAKKHNKHFAKDYKKTKPFGYTGQNGYDAHDDLRQIIDKGKERQSAKAKIRKEIEEYYYEDEDEYETDIF